MDFTKRERGSKEERGRERSIKTGVREGEEIGKGK